MPCLYQSDPPTLDAGSKQYRHFAIDDLRDIVYYCDVNPIQDGTFCFSNNHVVFGHTWTELPSYINQIDGYDPELEMVLFNEGKYATRDGMHFVSYADAALPVDALVESVMVPGLAWTQIKNIEWTGERDTYKGKFQKENQMKIYYYFFLIFSRFSWNLS